MQTTVQEIRIGAIYRLAAKLGMDRKRIASLLVERANLSSAIADQLSGHWVTTDRYRTGWVWAA